MSFDDFFGNLKFKARDDTGITLVARKEFAWHMSRVLKKIERRARTIVLAENHKTGKLLSSIHSDGVNVKRTNVYGSVSAGSARAPYAWYVHEGTDEHLITPNPPKEMLKFKWEGRTGRVSQLVRVQAKRESKNSYYGGSNIYDVNYLTGTTATSRRSGSGNNQGSVGVVGGTRYDGVKMSPKANNQVFGKVRRTPGQSRGNPYVGFGSNGLPTMMNDTAGVSPGTVVASRRLYRDEFRWGYGKIKDRDVMVPSVWHPGYKGNPFLRTALRTVIREYGWYPRI